MSNTARAATVYWGLTLAGVCRDALCAYGKRIDAALLQAHLG